MIPGIVNNSDRCVNKDLNDFKCYSVYYLQNLFVHLIRHDMVCSHQRLDVYKHHKMGRRPFLSLRFFYLQHKRETVQAGGSIHGL